MGLVSVAVSNWPSLSTTGSFPHADEHVKETGNADDQDLKNDYFATLLGSRPITCCPYHIRTRRTIQRVSSCDASACFRIVPITTIVSV